MKPNMKPILSFLVFTALLFVWTAPAVAQIEYMDLDTIQKIPEFDNELTVEEFEAQSDLYEEHPQGDKFLSYYIRLPYGWSKAPSSLSVTHKEEEREKVGLSQRILGQVTKFYGPGRIETRSRFEVVAQTLDFEVTAKNWFMQEVLQRGFVMEGLRVVSDKRVEVLYVVVEGDTPFLVRAAAEINGPRMVVASYYVPEQFWEEEKAFQEKSIESFEFISPEMTKIEMTRTHSFLDLLSFDYPASWRLVCPNVYTLAGMECFLSYSIDDRTLSGEIHISILSVDFDKVVEDEIMYLKKEIERRGLKFGDLIENDMEYDLPPQVYYNHTEIYKARDEQEKFMPHEYWVSVMEEDRYYYVVTMLTLARDSEFYTWARNAETFQTIVESFRH